MFPSFPFSLLLSFPSFLSLVYLLSVPVCLLSVPFYLLCCCCSCAASQVSRAPLFCRAPFMHPPLPHMASSPFFTVSVSFPLSVARPFRVNMRHALIRRDMRPLRVGDAHMNAWFSLAFSLSLVLWCPYLFLLPLFPYVSPCLTTRLFLFLHLPLNLPLHSRSCLPLSLRLSRVWCSFAVWGG